MKILFIGGTGNISTDCAALLHSLGHEVWVLSRGKNRVPPQYRSLVADRKAPASMAAALGTHTFDSVVNFIGYTKEEVEADYRLFQGRVGQYVFTSSTTVYVKPAPTLPITETTPRGNPYWDYAAKKLECEHRLEELFTREHFPVTIVRPSHTYSKLWVPNAASSSSYTFAARLEAGRPVFVHDGGKGLWTLTAARDFAKGLAGLVGNPKAIGEAFHITSNEVLTWNEIYATIGRALGATCPEIVPIPASFIAETEPRFSGTLLGDKAHPGVFDTSKVKSLAPIFECTTSFATGVAESIAWLRQHPEQQNLNAELDAAIDHVITRWRQREGK